MGTRGLYNNTTIRYNQEWDTEFTSNCHSHPIISCEKVGQPESIEHDVSCRFCSDLIQHITIAS